MTPSPPAMRATSGGTAIFLATPAITEPSGGSDMLGLRTTTGDMFYLKPGNTWFQVMPPPDQQNPIEEWLRINPE